MYKHGCIYIYKKIISSQGPESLLSYELLNHNKKTHTTKQETHETYSNEKQTELSPQNTFIFMYLWVGAVSSLFPIVVIVNHK